VYNIVRKCSPYQIYIEAEVNNKRRHFNDHKQQYKLNSSQYCCNTRKTCSFLVH